MTRRLLTLSGLAVIGAVLNHTIGWGFTSLFFWADRYDAAASVPDFSRLGSSSYYGLRAVEQLATYSVPAFLFVSGFFVAFASGRKPQKVHWQHVAGRLKMLLVPYVLWSAAIVVGRALEGAAPESPVGYLELLLFGRAAEPYYYIPLLTQLYLLSPLIVPLLERRWKAVLATAGLLQIVVVASRYPVLLGWDVPVAAWIWRHAPGWFFPHMAFWFVLGASAGSHPGTFRKRLLVWKPWLPWMTVATGALAFAEWELIRGASGGQWLSPAPTILDLLFSGSFILTFLAFAQSGLPRSARLDWLGERSFGVYLVHAPVLETLSRAMYHLVPILLAWQIVFQPLLLAIGLAVPILMMAAVKRSPARPYYNYLFG